MIDGFVDIMEGLVEMMGVPGLFSWTADRFLLMRLGLEKVESVAVVVAKVLVVVVVGLVVVGNAVKDTAGSRAGVEVLSTIS